MTHRTVQTSLKTLPLLLLGSAGIFALFGMISMEAVQKIIISSDQLTIISLADDIRHNPHFNAFLWNFSRAPYFFPDLVISLGFSTIISSDVKIAILMLIMQSGFIVAIGYLVCIWLGRTRERAVSISAIYGSMLILNCIGARHGWYPDAVMWPFISYSHASALDLTLLGFAALAAGRYASPRHAFWLAVSTLITTLAYVSDKTSIVLFLLPALAYTLLKPTTARALTLGVFVFVQTVALTTMWIVDHTFYFQIMEGNVIGAIPAHLKFMIHLFNAQRLSFRIISGLSAASVLFVWIRSIIWINRSDQGQAFDRCGIAFLLTSSSFMNAALCIWLWSGEEPGFARYAVMLEFASPILLAYSLTHFIFFRMRDPETVGLSVVASMLVTGVIGWQGSRDPVAAFTKQQERGREIRTCVKENGLHSGIAAYWIARQLSSSTNWKVQIDQLEPAQPYPFFWGSDLIWFFDKLDGGQPVHHDFIVLNDLSPEDVFNKYGRPSEVVECGALKLAVYHDSGHLENRIRYYMSTTIAIPSVRDHLPRSIVANLDAHRLDFDVNDLRSLVGRRGANSITLTAGDKAGYALYGPYLPLNVGRYHLNITFTCSDGVDGSFFEVAAGIQHSRIADWQIGGHPGICDGREQHARFGFDANQALSLVEVRAFYGGYGDLTISGVHLETELGM